MVMPIPPEMKINLEAFCTYAAALACELRGSRIVNSVNSPTRLSTVIVPPCCWVTMS